MHNCSWPHTIPYLLRPVWEGGLLASLSLCVYVYDPGGKEYHNPFSWPLQAYPVSVMLDQKSSYLWYFNLEKKSSGMIHCVDLHYYVICLLYVNSECIAGFWWTRHVSYTKSYLATQGTLIQYISQLLYSDNTVNRFIRLESHYQCFSRTELNQDMGNTYGFLSLFLIYNINSILL